MKRGCSPACSTAAWIAALLAGAASATASETNTQSALSPAGYPASDIHVLWSRTMWLLAGVYGVTLALTLLGAWRRRSRGDQTLIDTSHEKRLTGIVSTGVVITIVILFVLLIGDFTVGNKARSLAREPDPLTIEVTGHQWWWEIRYQDETSSLIANDANEIHVPVNRPIRFELKGADVIHSFWVPNISGKKDLIPGHPTSLTLKATQVGTFWGQCAEFCGYQHAMMRFAFIVQTHEDFESWIKAQRLPAQLPATDLQKRGMQVFMGRTCSMCHTIQGTSAGGRLGPDLTHIASRATLAAGSLPNSMGHLAGWVADPQGIKPGTRMPQQQLSADDLQSLLEYLENLK